MHLIRRLVIYFLLGFPLTVSFSCPTLFNKIAKKSGSVSQKRLRVKLLMETLNECLTTKKCLLVAKIIFKKILILILSH